MTLNNTILDENLPIIDQDAMAEVRTTMGDSVNKIMNYFIQDTDQYIRDISSGIDNKNLQDIMVAGHTIKSSAFQIGLQRIGIVARNIEYFARSLIENKTITIDTKTFEELTKLKDKLTEEFNNAKIELKKLFSL